VSDRSFVVLGLMGESGSGKDFSAAWIIQNQGYVRVGFADILKRFVKVVFEFSDEALWGDPKFRNENTLPCLDVGEVLGVTSDISNRYWSKAYFNLVTYRDKFVDELPLSIEEKAKYKYNLGRWFNECDERSDEGLISARLVLQLLGTEYGRGFKETLWYDYVFEKVVPEIEKCNGYSARKGVIQIATSENVSVVNPGIVITDVRFRTELDAIQERGGYVIKIIRLAHKNKENEAEKAGIAGHASEAEQREIPNEAYDVVLEMGEGAENVYPRLERMFEEKEWESRTESGKGSSTEPNPRKKEPTGDTSKS